MTVDLSTLRPHLASLEAVAVSAQARDLCSSMGAGIAVHEQNTSGKVYQRAKRGQEKLDQAVGAFLADLLMAANDPGAAGWAYRAMRNGEFVRRRVGVTTFKTVLLAMITLGFVEPHEDNEIRGPSKARASHWRATERLLRLAAGKGIMPDNVNDHFQQGLPERPVALRGSTERHGRYKVRGERIAFKATPKSLEIEGQVVRLNQFMDGFEVRGGNHRGYIRIFNNGDQPGYAWNKGGRLFSLCPGSYQSMESHLRPLMTIGGEPVVEIDIRASYLTALHGLAQRPFDPSQDAYDLEDLLPAPLGKDMRRWVAKKWAVATLSLESTSKSWPAEIGEEFEALTGKKLGKVYSIRQVQQAMESKHPLLKEWGTLRISWADLMYHESQAIMGAMLELMDEHSIPSLAVHDSLIVRKRDVDVARAAMSKSYKIACGIEPHLPH